MRRNKVMQSTGREAPRLTGYLRAFGSVSSEVSRQPVLVDETLIRRKQKIRRASDAPEKKWSELKEELVAKCGRAELRKVHLLVRIN